jgi:plastocyanin
VLRRHYRDADHRIALAQHDDRPSSAGAGYLISIASHSIFRSSDMRTFLALCCFAVAGTAFADDPTFEIAIRDHRFVPNEITVPAGQKVKLIVKNDDPTPEEFESKRLNREKVIPGRSRATIYIGPLKPGEYPFVGEFNESTATGKIVVK